MLDLVICMPSIEVFESRASTLSKGKTCSSNLNNVFSDSQQDYTVYTLGYRAAMGGPHTDHHNPLCRRKRANQRAPSGGHAVPGRGLLHADRLTHIFHPGASSWLPHYDNITAHELLG